MRRVLTAMALLLGLPLSVAACLWDRDTPVDEARGLPEVVAVLTGRFERNPPLFYEMRLEAWRPISGAIPGPRRLRRRRGRLRPPRARRRGDLRGWRGSGSNSPCATSRIPRCKEQFYRYHANLGTFLVHRWARQGADRAKIDEVKARATRSSGPWRSTGTALRPREIPVAGAEMDHRPAEGRGRAGPAQPPRLELRRYLRPADRAQGGRPVLPGSPVWSSSGMPGKRRHPNLLHAALQRYSLWAARAAGPPWPISTASHRLSDAAELIDDGQRLSAGAEANRATLRNDFGIDAMPRRLF